MKSFGSRLLRRMNELNLKAADLSKKTGISGSTISLYISGKRTPSSKAVVKVAQALQCSTDLLLMGREPEPPDYDIIREIVNKAVQMRTHLIRDAAVSDQEHLGPIPILPYDRAGLTIERESKPYRSTEEYEHLHRPPDVDDPDAYALRVVGDNMSPKIEEGEYVIVAPRREIKSGDIAVVRTNRDVVMVNKVILKGEMVILQNINPTHEPKALTRDELEFIQKVLYIKLP